MYSIEFTTKAVDDLALLQKSSPKDFVKAKRFLEELKVHPRTGTGHPEALKGGKGIRWSRAINKKDRLEYDIYDDVVLVNIISALGHYGDK